MLSSLAAFTSFIFLLMSQQGGFAYDALILFGDSYTDTGNLPSTPPDYWNGRFSNGPTWGEYMSEDLGFAYKSNNNFAVSGSSSDELGVQIARFPGVESSSNPLCAVWSGSNDLDNRLNLGFDDSAWSDTISRIVASLKTAADLLYQKGARDILVVNIPDLTRHPYLRDRYTSEYRNYVSQQIQALNNLWTATIPPLLSAHPGLHVYTGDIFTAWNQWLDHYADYGFANATIGALNDPALPDKSWTGPGANYVFWDSEHPTTRTHELIATTFRQLLPNNIGTPDPPVLSLTQMPDHTVLLSVSGGNGHWCQCEYSADLQTWAPFSTNLLTSGSMELSAPLPPSGCRFYRAALVP